MTLVFLCASFFCILSYLSCNPGQPAKTLILTTKWPVIPITQWGSIRQSLEAGNRTLDDVQFGRLTCDFVTDYSVSPLPRVIVNGAQGDPSFNISFASIRLSGVPSSSGCVSGTNLIPTEVHIESGRPLVVGQVQKVSNMTVVFGNDIFTSDYSEFTLTSFNQTNRNMTGNFQMFATNHGNPQDQRVLIVVDGSFSAQF